MTGSMHRRDFLKRSGLLASLALMPGAGRVFGQSESPGKKPNFLVILVDDMGYSDPGFMGGEIDTPNLDRLAREGLVFTRAMNCAVCSPTRAALLTGVYSHRAGYPSLAGRLNPDVPTLAEMLNAEGYRTRLSGKWHLHQNGTSPEDRGFEHFFGLMGGADTHWGGRWKKGVPVPTEGSEPVYSSDAIAQNAIAFLEEDRDSGRPFFLYLSFTAPHYPIHAPHDLIEAYEPRYREGWDAVRTARWEKQQSIGLFPGTAQLPDDRIIGPRFQEPEWANEPVPAWDSLPDDRQKDLIRRMAIHAAMVDRADVNIGRVLEALKASGQLENTVIFFASDNGCSAQGGAFGGKCSKGPKTNHLFTGDELEQLGGPDSNETLGAGWARTSNTPLRYSKAHSHAGGNMTPLLIWGAPVQNRAGQRDATPCHMMDITPTCLALTDGTPPPSGFDGASLAGVCRGEALPERTLFFDLNGEQAVVTPQWRLVKPGKEAWELYNERTDPTESTDVARENPDVVQELTAAHAAWMKSMNAAVKSFKTKQKETERS